MIPANDDQLSTDRAARCQAQLVAERLRQERADVRVLDCYGSRRSIQIQNAAPAPKLGRGCYAYETPGRFALTDRAWEAYKAANPALDIVTDF